MTFATVVLKRGMTTTRDLWNWFQLVAGGAYSYRLDARITLQSHSGQPVLTWVLDRALPVKFKAADFNAKGSEVGIEELHLAHEGLRLETAWQGSPLMSTPTPAIEALATARFKTVKAAEPIEVTVHFNPASLQYTVSNTLKDQGSGSKKKQYVSQTTAKLTMDLVFDTTATGEDVRETTDKMAKLLKPHGPSGKQVPPLVEFGWGVYRFTGMVEQYKETLDFFAAGGVPLRPAST